MLEKAEKAILIAIVGGLSALVWTVICHGREATLSRYVTSLDGRTRSQRHNSVLAAQRIDGLVIQKGGAVSFNEAVGPWTGDRGYVKAPVSYDGELLPAWGGGVCQTSSTLYNAGLLAGLTIVERHRHEWPPGYVAPGRDAAVAYPSIDLALGNPYPWPVRVEAQTEGDAIAIRIVGKREPRWSIAVSGKTRCVTRPAGVRLTDAPLDGRRRLVTRGRTGFETAVYRTYCRGAQVVRRELISVDHYRAMPRVVRVPSQG